MEKQCKKGIIMVSFGTTYEETWKKTISVLEDEVKSMYPDWCHKNAFTSGMIINSLKQRGIEVATVTEALQAMYDENIEEVIIQPTLLIEGDEYEKMCYFTEAFKGYFKSLHIGYPLLHDLEDLDYLATFYGEAFERQEDEAIVLMGHGTEHVINVIYGMFQERLELLKYDFVRVATVEATPTIDEVVACLRDSSYTKVVLTPLMLVAGDHAHQDMASTEEESWKSLLEQAGYSVRVDLRGMGEYQAIRSRYLKHLEILMHERVN